MTLRIVRNFVIIHLEQSIVAVAAAADKPISKKVIKRVEENITKTEKDLKTIKSLDPSNKIRQ